MNLYVPLLKDMNGNNAAAGVFTTYEKAQEHLESIRRDGTIITTAIPTEDIKDNSVYLALYYDEDGDVHAYKGVYTDFDVAKREAGKHSLVLNIKLS